MFQFAENARYQVRDLIQVPIPEMCNSPEAANITLVFDDGEIPSTSRECILARHYWECYSVFPICFVSKRHHIHAHRRHMTGGVDAEIMNDLVWDNIRYCREQGVEPPPKQVAFEAIYRVTDSLDHLFRDQSHYALTIDAIGIIDILHHPEVVKIHEHIQDKVTRGEMVTNTDIANGNFTVDKLMTKDPTIAQSMVGKYYRFGSIKTKQYAKFISPMGYVTDVDNYTIRSPIISSLMGGMTSIEELIVESRTASMSISNQKGAIRDSEYLTRQLQLGVSSIWRVHRNTDCGSTHYHPGVIENKSDLMHYKGKYYVDPKDGTLKAIRGDEYHLISKDTTINFRTVIGCKHGDRYGFCSTCLGEMSEMLYDTDNLGMISASIVQEIMTQLILSTKHHLASANGETISFSQTEQNYITTKAQDHWSFYLNPKLKNRKVSIAFLSEEARRLPEIEHGMDLDNISPLRLSRLNEVVFRTYKDELLIEEVPISVSTFSQRAYFTSTMLAYIRERGWSVDANGNYEVMLDGWDFTKQAIGLPMVQFSTPAHMRAVKEMLTTQDAKGKTASGNPKNSIMIHKTPGAALSAFQDLIRQKLSVNFVHLEVIISTYLTQDPNNHDFRVPKYKSDGKLAPFKDIMTMRDFSLAMAFEKQFDTFKDLRSYIVEHRPPHPHTNALRG